jgi:crotonobetainyl-CoA:carnitine CoA-transferase CaiB-like acyl-CoA transferase
VYIQYYYHTKEKMSGTNDQKGPLAHLRVIELAGLAPVPYAGLILKQFGADVIHVQRTGSQPEDPARLGLVSFRFL